MDEIKKPRLPTDAELNQPFDEIRDRLKFELDDHTQQIRELTETPSPKEPSENEELENKLEEVEARLSNARRTYSKAQTKGDGFSASFDRDTGKSLGLGMMYASYLIGGPLVGYLLGLLLNKLSGIQGWERWLVIAGFGLGIAGVAVAGQTPKK